MDNFSYIVDMHTHSDNSFDGNHSPVYMCEVAINKGVRAILFCDHCESDAFVEGNYARSVRQAFFEVAKAKSAFMGNILVLNGIELGQPHYDIETSEKIISSQKFDAIVGSVHNLRGQQDFYFIEDYLALDYKKMTNEYFDEILNMLQWGNFDILAHLTYPFRYLFKKNNILENIDDYSDKVDEILSLTAEKDIALEINTAALRQPLNRLSPEFSTIKKFKKLGGKLITIGSDAHFAKDIAVGYNHAASAAVEAGFENAVIFQNRQPVEIPLK